MTTFQRTGHRERFWLDASPYGTGTRVPVSSRAAAFALLRDLKRDAWGWAALRRLYAEAVGRTSICGVNDQAVLEGLALRLEGGSSSTR